MSTARRLHHTYDDYLALLERGDTRLEYCDGEIFAMAGGTPTHAELTAAMIATLRSGLVGRCRVYSSCLKVRIEATDLSTFPDATVVCGDPQSAAIDRDTVVNPTIVVEVTSRSTEDYDRGEKLSHYKQLRALQAVLLVSHRRPQITVVSRDGVGWSVCEVRAGERVALANPAIEFSIDQVYEGVEFEAG